MTLRCAAVVLLGTSLVALAGDDAGVEWKLTREKQKELRKMQESCDYPAIARAYADYMIKYGRDRYGKVHSPLFVSVIDRKTGTVFRNKNQVPYPHAATKPFAPGLMRDVKLRPHDRHYTGANPVEDLPLYELLGRPDVLARVIHVLRRTYRMTDNPMYLRRAEHFAQLAVRLLFDDTSPLPKISSFDDWYESNWKNGSSVEIIGQMLELSLEIKAMEESQRTIPVVALQPPGQPPATNAAGHYSPTEFQADLKAACAEGRGGVWDGSGLGRASQDVYLEYGVSGQKRRLYLSQAAGTFAPVRQAGAALAIGVSDVINKIPTVKEADKVNGARKTRFTGKYIDVAAYSHAGFKDVLKSCGLLIGNNSRKEQVVVLTATFHDTYHDNRTETITGTVPAKGTMFFAVKAPSRKYVRKLHVQSRNGSYVSIKNMAFVMNKRNAL